MLVGTEPLQALAHHRMGDGKTARQKSVRDQPGRIAIGLGKQRSIELSGPLKRRGFLVPSPRTERLQRPTAVVALLALNLLDECLPLLIGEQILQPSRG